MHWIAVLLGRAELPGRRGQLRMVPDGDLEDVVGGDRVRAWHGHAPRIGDSGVLPGSLLCELPEHLGRDLLDAVLVAVRLRSPARLGRAFVHTHARRERTSGAAHEET